ncbi:hypothetical protein TUBRATIS_28300, partial [Tubulinosema ratisbonensis]
NNLKLERLKRLVYEIKNKLDRLIKINYTLNDFNFKLHALLIALEEVSSEILPEDIQEEVSKIEESVITVHSESTIKQELNLDDFLEKVYSVINPNSTYKICIEKVVKLIYKSNIISHEDLIKKCGISKYRCVEVINLLGKTQPQFLLKNHEKGIFYYLNMKYE